jgi:hypothetical protein
MVGTKGCHYGVQAPGSGKLTGRARKVGELQMLFLIDETQSSAVCRHSWLLHGSYGHSGWHTAMDTVR